jgi:hypothetical protein
MTYYIINLPATRQAGKVIFWGRGAEPDTPDPEQALIVSEEYVNAALHRYDNGATTRAILASVVRNYDGDLMELLTPKKPATKEGDAA